MAPNISYFDEYIFFQICGKQLRDKYKLKYHMMVHTDKKHFRCCACPAQFKGRENLRKHVAKFHNELLSRNVSGGNLGGSIKAATKTNETHDDATGSCSKKDDKSLQDFTNQ